MRVQDRRLRSTGVEVGDPRAVSSQSVRRPRDVVHPEPPVRDAVAIVIHDEPVGDPLFGRIHVRRPRDVDHHGVVVTESDPVDVDPRERTGLGVARRIRVPRLREIGTMVAGPAGSVRTGAGQSSSGSPWSRASGAAVGLGLVDAAADGGGGARRRRGRAWGVDAGVALAASLPGRAGAREQRGKHDHGCDRRGRPAERAFHVHPPHCGRHGFAGSLPGTPESCCSGGALDSGGGSFPGTPVSGCGRSLGGVEAQTGSRAHRYASRSSTNGTPAGAMSKSAAGCSPNAISVTSMVWSSPGMG